MPQAAVALRTLFVTGAIGSLAVLATIGRFGLHEAVLGLALAPPMLIGFAVSNVIVPHVDRGKMRVALLVMSALAAMALLVLQMR